MQKEGSRISPCVTCIKGSAPKNCENKDCSLWRNWFEESWEITRRTIIDQLGGTRFEDSGISVGGNKYHHPDRIRSYLTQDPCAQCVCPKDICVAPCAARRAWEADKEEAMP